jgi:hypothetical protein
MDIRFYLSLSAGVFSAIWKEFFDVPLFKSGNKRDVSCYRGISILSAIPNLFQKMICDRRGAEIPKKQQGSRRGFYRGRAVEKRWT